MSKLSLVYDLANGTDIDAIPVQSNFVNIENTVNNELIERDGSVEMRQELLLSGNPTSARGAAPKQYVEGYGLLLIPIGGIIMWGGAAVPSSMWKFADGSLVSTTTYPDLFAIYGYTYGGSGGSFGLPPLMSGNGRVPMGFAGTVARGAVGGTADAVVVTHVHDMGHNHTASGSGTTGITGTDHTHNFSGTTTQYEHYHQILGGKFVTNDTFSPSAGINTAGGTGYVLTDSTTHDFHQHTYSGTTTGFSANHTHSFSATVTVVAFSGNTGGAAGGVAGTNQNLPPYVGIGFLVRVL